MTGSQRYSDPWGDLRSLRSAPTGFAGDDVDRREVYLAALEQSEQLLRGAADLGYASRPLSLFYGLSQAGRAIAAAWSPPQFSDGGNDLAWQLSGHGIKFSGTVDDMTPPTLDTLALVDAQPPLPAQSKKRLAAFPAVARVLGSSSLARPVKLVDLWALLPEAIGRPAPGDESRWGPLVIDWNERYEDRNAITRGVQTWTHNWPNRQLQQWKQLPGNELNSQIALAISAQYPSLAQPIIIQSPWEVNWFGDYRGSVLLTWEMSQNGDAGDRQWYLQAMATSYRKGNWAFPSAAGQRVSPIVAWWAVLYSLSMLARYYPRMWAQTIDVDRSEWATPLEHLMTEALTALPEVIFEALEHAPLAEHDYRLPGDGILDYGSGE